MASTINWKNINDEITQKAIVAVNSSLNDLKVEIDRNTPIDTAELIQNTVITPATIIGQRVSGTVSNDTPYAVYVEYGVQQKTYNYHKYKQIFYINFFLTYMRDFDFDCDKVSNSWLKVLHYIIV